MRSLVVLFSILVFVLAFIQNGTTSEKEKVSIFPDFPVKKPTYPKLATELSNFLDVYHAKGLIEAQEFAWRHGVELMGEMVHVEIIMRHGHLPSEITDEMLSKFGAVIDSRSEHFMLLFIPIERLAEFAVSIDIISLVHRPIELHPCVTSQGFELSGAPPFHEAGIRGEGVKIAIIDVDFYRMREVQQECELPEEVTARDFSGRGMEQANIHGAGCAEIVYDFAPEAEYWFVKAQGTAQVENALRYVIEQGIDIFSMSLGYWKTTTSYYQGDHPLCELFDEAFENDILPVTSAGNSAIKHYRSDFDDADFANYHSFVEGNNLNRYWSQFHDNLNWFQEGDRIETFLCWDDYPETDQDYDLLLFWFNENNQWERLDDASSTNEQDGNDPPIEDISFAVENPGRYSIAVRRNQGDEEMNFTLWLGGNANIVFQYNTPEGSVTIPANARNAVAVGAIDQAIWNDDEVEPTYYSSRGPTYDGEGRLKPEICGPTHVRTMLAESAWGTSAAAPHVAGAAALLLSKYPDMTAGNLRD